MTTPQAILPTISRVSFSCPHCGALAHQSWFTAAADAMKKGQTPSPFTPESVERLVSSASGEPIPPNLIEDLRALARGLVRLEAVAERRDHVLHNVWFSRCYSCGGIAIWVYDKLIFPPLRSGPVPNADLPTEIKADFDEARTVSSGSPRSAAALLRLSIQKLCKYLGEPGKDLNTDIGNLVKKGLPVRIQQALDIVRVVGNNAVHPGRMDVKDDQATATKLFDLVNMIAETMITQPAQLQTMFDGLPDGAKEQIERRNKPNT